MDTKSMLINLEEFREDVDYQSGAGTKAPRFIFAAQDYEECDGTFGLSTDGKYVSEPAIVYIRADVSARMAARATGSRLMGKRIIKMLEGLGENK